MLQIVFQGDDAYHLTEPSGRVVGWIRGATIRVGGFDSARAAMDAAVRGDRAIESRIGPMRGEAADAVACGAPPATRLAHDGAYEWVVAGRRPIARLVRRGGPGVAAHTEPRPYALEFVVPASVPAAASGSVPAAA